MTLSRWNISFRMMAVFCLGSQLAQRAQTDKPELEETLPLWTIHGSSLSLSSSSHRVSLPAVSAFPPEVRAGSNPAHGMCFFFLRDSWLARPAQSQTLLFSFFFLFFKLPTQPPPPRAPPPPTPTPSSFKDRSDVGPTYMHLERSCIIHKQQLKRFTIKGCYKPIIEKQQTGLFSIRFLLRA